MVDMRGSGASYKDGAVGWVNAGLRQTVIPEVGNDDWTMDDEALYDVPAILEYVREQTGHARCNWVGHSLGGMLMFAFFERSPYADRVSNFVAMGSPACVAESPERDRMLRANRGLRVLLKAAEHRPDRPAAVDRQAAAARHDRPLLLFGRERRGADRRPLLRLHPGGPGAGGPEAARLATWRRATCSRPTGRSTTSSGSTDVDAPTLVVAGDGDILADLYSNWRTYEALGSADKTFLRFGRAQGHVADYGHCDLVWSRHAPVEIFPEIIDWLDERQPGVTPSPQSTPRPRY